MTEDALEDWLTRYKRAWENQDPDLFVTLFSDDATYRERPFMEDVHGNDFHQFWSDLATRQADNQITLEVVAVKDQTGVVNWRANSTRVASGERREGNGIFVLTFEPDGRCSRVREWQDWRRVGDPLAKGWPWREDG